LIISFIVAAGTEGQIGKDNRMLWHIKEDFIHFKKTTTGHTLLMGRKTFESIGRPLPGRKTYILTRDQSYQKDGCTTIHSLEQGIQLARESGESELFIAGGADVYHQSIGLCDKGYLSEVDFNGDADAFFPKLDHTHWDVTKTETFAGKEKSPAWTLKVLKKKI